MRNQGCIQKEDRFVGGKKEIEWLFDRITYRKGMVESGLDWFENLSTEVDG